MRFEIADDHRWLGKILPVQVDGLAVKGKTNAQIQPGQYPDQPMNGVFSLFDGNKNEGKNDQSDDADENSPKGQ